MSAVPGGAPAATRRFDVCNGDADGLCAVLQWRLHTPAQATLVTGLKREIELLDRVQAVPGDEVLACDISMQRNLAALLRLLEQGARVRYFDHHAVSEVPTHARLEAHVEFDAATCTSLLMDRHLGGASRAWALVGAYGDNLIAQGDALAGTSGLGGARGRLRMIGEAVNYNAYGETEQDVRIAPRRLYTVMARYRDPLQFLAQEPIVAELDGLRLADLQLARAVAPHWRSEHASALLLPDAPWSRRVLGCVANELANAHPQRAHAVLKPIVSGDYVVSVRAPRVAPGGAAQLCALFGGAGRAAAAGIDRLPARELGRFIDAFAAAHWGAKKAG
ncbi:MAG: hypothetical protein OEY03_03085 [Rhizobacter sp.]|nr:hypothetical protein [Rhizobacter sp.]